MISFRRCSRVLVASLFLTSVGVSSTAWGQSLVASVLPTSRSVEVGSTASAFATILNTGSETATDCSIAPATPVTFR